MLIPQPGYVWEEVSQFVIEWGTRQGDPLSSLFLNISIELLAQLIRNFPITISATSHSLSLYADDTFV